MLSRRELLQRLQRISMAEYETLGSGVTGYTLEFAAVCGATGTCTAEDFIDNVEISVQ